MKRFWTMALCLALACGLPGCGEGKSPGTLTLTVSGNYAEDFTARGWTTARLTAAAVDAEGRSLPIDGNIVWWIQTADLHDNIVATTSSPGTGTDTMGAVCSGAKPPSYPYGPAPTVFPAMRRSS